MSAVIVKGIIISLSVVAAVGIALQNPDVQDWIAEQRRKLAELLRSVSEGLDAETRREAEAFAFEGQMPSNRGAATVDDAVALVSGRETEGDTLGRRLVREPSTEKVDADERRRLGREYLARRNQELLDMKRKRESEQLAITEKNDTATDTPLIDLESTKQAATIDEKAIPLAIAAANFDTLVNNDGSLKPEETPETSGMDSLENKTVTNSAFDTGAQFGNPFGDEFVTSDALSVDRSATPKPPVPPKVSVSPRLPAPTPASAPASAEPIRIPIESPAETAIEATGDMEFDEQLARALSLSLAEKEEQTRKTLRRTMTEEEAFAHAIAESLRDADKSSESTGDFSSAARNARGISSDDLPTSDQDAGLSSNNPWRARSEDEDLYFLTPMQTGQVRRSRIMEHEAESLAAALHEHAQKAVTEKPAVPASSTSKTVSPQVRPSSPTSATLSPLLAPRDALSSGFNTDSEVEDYASLPDSSTRSVASMIEVEDVDIESMDDDDDGIATPSSWSEISSQVDEHERSESESSQVIPA